MNSARSLYNRLPLAWRARLRSSLPDALLRWYAHRNTDVYLLSYPKCGRTWLRLLIGRAICEHFGLPQSEEILFLQTNRRFHPQAPRITVIHDDRPMLKAPGELAQTKEQYRDKRVIFLARDPRDVVVSSYFEMVNRSPLIGDNPYEKRQATFSGSLNEFIRRSIGGYDTILAYYNIWAENRDTPKAFLLVRYEDLKADPQRELRRVLDFLGLQAVTPAEIDAAVRFASFDNMQKMERERRFGSALLTPADPAKPDTYKTRKGKIHGYLDYLTPNEVQNLDRKLSENLVSFYGYSPTGEKFIPNSRNQTA